MDAWETLTSNSTLADGDAWEHLNAQEGGGGTIETIYVPVAAVVTVEAYTPTSDVDQDQFEIESAGEFSVDILEVIQYSSVNDTYEVSG